MASETPGARKKSKSYLRKGHGMKCKECRFFSCYKEEQGKGLCLNSCSSHFGDMVDERSLFMECRREDIQEELVSFIPKDGTLEWAQYVENHYSTDYFKPVDLFRAGMIIERARWEKEAGNLK